MSSLSRRSFLGTASVSVAFLGLHRLLGPIAYAATDAEVAGYGPLVADPNGVLDLPNGFSYVVLSRTGQTMDDELLVPGKHDGMAAFPGPGGLTVLVRNHEIDYDIEDAPHAFGDDLRLLSKISPGKLYDRGFGKTPGPGGTTTVLYNTRARIVERHFLSLAGTVRNCAGGLTPWNSWISCEETVVRADGERYEVDHGYCFEVPANAEIGIVDPVPIKPMGRFYHEAIAVDPKSGIVYQTEDRHEGLFYRYIPNTPGKLLAGGKLQALRARTQKSLDTRNWLSNARLRVGQVIDVEWVDMEDIDSPTDEMRMWGYYAKGCARFARGEGIWYGRDAVYFACTNGGSRKQGQIFRYTPSPVEGTSEEANQPGRIELFLEPDDSNLLENADNLTIAPWGDVITTEDGPGENRVVGVTPRGRLYTFARNALNDSELAGACFSPDGTTLFVNIQTPGLTLAVTGRWQG